MEAVPKAVFLASAAARGIGVDPVYQKSWPRNLTFQDGPAPSRYWDFAEGAAGVLAGVLSTLRWRSIDVWPKVEDWGAALRATMPEENLSSLRYIANSIGAPLGTDGAIRFRREDGDALLALLTALASEGWSWPEDAYLLPDAEDILLMLDHHGALHAEFRSMERLAEFVAAMEECGFPLPTKPPDSTFKPVPWMAP